MSTIAQWSEHTCVIDAAQTVSCWGRGSEGQLGDGAQVDSASAVQVRIDSEQLLTDIVDIDVGMFHSCALDGADQVWCWGEGSNGELGDGSSVDSGYATSVRLDAGTNLNDVIDLDVGASHACAVRASGGVWCWGDGSTGALGRFTFDNEAYAQQVYRYDESYLGNITQVSAGDHATCAVANDTRVWCWGRNDDGELGTLALSQTYADIVQSASGDLTNIQQVSIGTTHACAVDTSGQVWCWGGNSFGQLGDGSTGSRDLADTVLQTPSTNLSGISSVATGGSHTCARDDDGQVWCWGSASSGQIGNGSVSVEPIALYADLARFDINTTLTGVMRVSSGSAATCAVNATLSQAWCWGQNAMAQLGDSTMATRAWVNAVTVWP